MAEIKSLSWFPLHPRAPGLQGLHLALCTGKNAFPASPSHGGHWEPRDGATSPLCWGQIDHFMLKIGSWKCHYIGVVKSLVFGVRQSWVQILAPHSEAGGSEARIFASMRILICKTELL